MPDSKDKKQKTDDKATAERRDATLKTMLNTPPKPFTPKKSDQRKSSG